MEGLLNNLLSQDKSSRESSEIQLDQLKSKNPFDFYQSLIFTFQSSHQDNVKLLSCVILRQSLPQSWTTLDINSKTVLKSLLLNIFPSISSFNIARNASYVISDLAIFIIQSETGEKWSNFLTFLLKSLKSRNLFQKFSGFLILSEIVPYFAETFSKLKEKLIKIFMKTIESPYSDLRRATIQSFTVFISVINTSETLNYSEILKPLLNSVQFLCVNSLEHGEPCVKSLIELAETEPFYFRADLGLCYSFVEALTGKVTSENLKVNLLEFIIILIDKHMNLVFNKKNILAGTCERIFEVLAQTSVDLQEEAATGTQKHLITLVKKMIEIIGESVVDYFLKLAENVLYDQRNENAFFAALVLLAETAGFLYATEKIVDIINAVHTFVLHERFSLRWASCKIVKKLVKVKDKEFQTRLHLSVLPILFRCLSDSCDLVKLIALKTVQNFLKINDSEISIKYSPDLLPLILPCLAQKSCISEVLEVLNLTFVLNKENISNFFPEIFAVLNALIKESSNEVKVKAFETLLLARKIISRAGFLNIASEYIQIVQLFQLSNDKSIQSCCFKSLITLSKYLKSSFTMFLPFVMPGLIQSASKMVVSQLEDYLEVILSLIDSTRGGFLQYMEKTSELVLYLMKVELTENLKILVVHIASALIDVIKESGNQDFFSILVVFARGFLKEIWNLCEKEEDVECLAEMLKSASHIISAPGYEFLTNEELKFMGQVTWKGVISLKNRKNEDLEQASGLIFQALSDGQAGSGIIEIIYANLLAMLGNTDRDQLIFSLIVLKAILNSVGSLLVYEKIEDFAKIFVFYLNHSDHSVKKASLQGFWALSEHIHPAVFVKIAPFLLSSLESVLNSVKDSKNLKDKKIKDLVVVTLGYIVKFKFECLNGNILVPWWASFLPVTSQKRYAQEAHDLLADLVVNHLQFLVKNDKIVILFVHIAFSELCSSKTLPKIRKILEMVLEEKPLELVYELFQSSQKHKIEKLLNYI